MKLDAYDLLAIFGAVVLSIGVAMLSIPAGVITAGIVIIFMALVGAAGRARHEGGKR